jgi:hypothetical protein
MHERQYRMLGRQGEPPAALALAVSVPIVTVSAEA